MKKVLLAAMKHETNTFLNYKTRSEDFTVIRNDDIKNNSDFPGTLGAMDELSKNPSIRTETTLFAKAMPGGIVDKNFYSYIKKELLENIEEMKPDGILLDLHGSMYVENIGDAEGDLLFDVRKIVGQMVPIVCVLDMHATMTEKMIENANAFAGYHTAPHVDIWETGVRAAKILKEFLEGRTLYMSAKRIPVLISGERSDTRGEPMKSLIKFLEDRINGSNIIDASYLLGFPWADVPSNGAYSVVIANNKEDAERLSSELAQKFWDKRKEFNFSAETFIASEAILAATKTIGKPVIISDICDNPTAGSAGDGTNLLKEIFEAQKRGILTDDRIAFISIPDPESLNRIISSEKDTVKIDLGGKIDNKYSSPLELSGLRKKVMMRYRNEVDVVLFSVKNVDIVITSKRFAVAEDWMLLKNLKEDPKEYKIIVLKSGYLSDEYASMAKHSFFALADGYFNQDITKIPFKKIERPIFPLDNI